MRMITVNLPDWQLRKLEDLVRSGYYPNRAEAIRAAIKDLLLSHGCT